MGWGVESLEFRHRTGSRGSPRLFRYGNRSWRLVGRRVGVKKANPLRLCDVLVADYDRFSKRLTHRLRSRDTAVEALHEAFLRLHGFDESARIQSPEAYIFRAAVNIAKNHQKAESYRAGSFESESVYEVLDEAPGPARIVEGRLQFEALKRAMAALPARRREVLIAVVIDGIPARAVAARLRVSLRTVESDLKQALEHCADHLDHKLMRRPGAPARS